MRTISTELNNSDAKIFEFVCEQNGTNKSRALKKLINDFVNNNSIRPGNANDSEVNEADLQDQTDDMTITLQPQKQREFRCDKGCILENDIIIGDCDDYDIDNGKVSQYGIQIGIIKPSIEMTNVEVIEN